VKEGIANLLAAGDLEVNNNTMAVGDLQATCRSTTILTSTTAGRRYQGETSREVQDAREPESQVAKRSQNNAPGHI
jgi:hypothetical protein